MADLSSFTSILELNIAFNSAFILIASRKNSVYRNILPHFSEKISTIKEDSFKLIESLLRSLNEVHTLRNQVVNFKSEKSEKKLNIIDKAKNIIDSYDALQKNIKTTTNINERTESKSNFFSHICFHLATYSLILLFISPFATKQFFLLLNCTLTIITLVVALWIVRKDIKLEEKYSQSSAIKNSILILVISLSFSFLTSLVIHNFTDYSISLQYFFANNQFIHNSLLITNLSLSIFHFIIYFYIHYRTINKFISDSEVCIAEAKVQQGVHESEMGLIVTEASSLMKDAIIADIDN